MIYAKSSRYSAAFFVAKSIPWGYKRSDVVGFVLQGWRKTNDFLSVSLGDFVGDQLFSYR